MSLRAPGPARRRARATRARHARGVSLIELVLVIMLIAVMTLLATGTLGSGLKGMELRSASREVAAQLRLTRTRAIATGQVQSFTIDPGAHTWQGADGRSGDIPESLEIVFTGAREAQPREGQGSILFFPDGASTGGRVQLARETAAWNIDVAWLTGEVRLRRAEAAP